MAGRQSTSNNLNRLSKVRDPKTVICVVTEGLTEMDYLKIIKNNNYFDRTILELEIADKTMFDLDVSDRMNLVRYVVGWRMLVGSGNCPLRMYVSIVLEYFYDHYSFGINIKDDIQELHRECCERFGNYVDNGIVPKGSNLYEDILRFCFKKYPDRSGNTPSLIKPPKLDPEISGSKRYYIMFDRDYSRDYRDTDDYNEVIDEMERNRIEALVTTPQFELWLLMHFKDVSFDEIEYNTPSMKIEHLLGKKDIFEYSDGKKHINDERAKIYDRDSILTAISTSLQDRFTTDVRELENKVGTRVGLFLRDDLGIRGP